MERRFDHAIQFSYPGYATRTMYVRRTVAKGPQWGNAGSCAVSLICIAFSGVDEVSGGEFNLAPDVLHAELRPGPDTAGTHEQSRVLFFNGNRKSSVTFSIDGGTECELRAQEYTTRALPAGHHDVAASDVGLLKMKHSTPLDLDGSDLYVAIYSTAYSTHAAFTNELPVEFYEVCVPGKERRVVRVTALNDGKLLLDGQPVTLPALNTALADLSHAIVWYHRQYPTSVQALQAENLFKAYRLDVRNSNRTDFSDLVTTRQE